ncbi:hypothetical protein [Clostridium sp.]|uniref:hypothetical protein n=1 Tax=Clostridium sp. TaxID=1506 RepID=UPI00321621B0
MKKAIISLSIIMGLFTFLGLYQGNKNVHINSVDNIDSVALYTSSVIMPMTGDPGTIPPR